MWKHDATPGPWTVRPLTMMTVHYDITDDNFRRVAYTSRPYPMSIKSEDANALLLAAAPALFDALAEIADYEDSNCDCPMCDAIRRGIAALKAAGGYEDVEA